jgi:molecular chaperone Hsp33
VSDSRTVPDNETGFDQVLGFTIPARDARGRVVRLGPVLDAILSAHDYPPAIRGLLAEALVICALIGSLLKAGDGQVTMQVQAEGAVVDLLVCDYRSGELRGYVRHDPERLAMLGANPSLYASLLMATPWPNAVSCTSLSLNRCRPCCGSG